MNKIKSYFYIQIPLILIVFCISVIFMQKNRRQDYSSDVSSLIFYDSDIFDKHKFSVGSLSFSLIDDIGVCSIMGKEIEDVTVYDLKYKLKNISYTDMNFRLVINKNEKYYFSEDENSCKVILKISDVGKKILSRELGKNSKESIYMFVEMTKDVYERALLRTEELSLQEIFISGEASNLYTCYFLQ